MSADPPALAGDATVAVFGGAVIRVEPDEALVWITLSTLADSPGPALHDVVGRTAALGEILDELAVPGGDRSTTGVTVAEELDHTQHGRRSLGHRAVATMTIRMTDTENIGQVIMRATGELDARVAGPSWRVSPANPAWLDAATQAAAHARTKAEAYAAGVNAQLGRLISLSEPEHPMRATTLAARSASGPDMQIEAGEQEVSATIQARFALQTA